MNKTRSACRRSFAIVALVVATAWAFCGSTQAADAVGLAKDAHVRVERDGSFLVTYTLRAANLGSGAIRDVVVEDDLAHAFGGVPFEVVAVESETAGVRPDFDGRSTLTLLDGTDALAGGQSLEITLKVRIRTDGQRVSLANSATVHATGADGTLSDRSQSGAEPDPDWDGVPGDHDEPTVVDLVPTARIGAAQETKSVTRTGDGAYEVTFSIVVENAGQLDLSAVNAQDNLRLAFPTPAEVHVLSLRSVDLEVNPTFDGISDHRLLSGRDVLAPGERGTVSLTLAVLPHGAGSWFENRVLVSATDTDGTSILDFSDTGSEVDPDADDDPTNNDRPTDVLLAQTTLSGFAESTVRLEALPVDFELQTLLLNATLRIDDLTARFDARLTNTSFDLLTFSLSGPIGALSTSSTLTFNPSTLHFVSWLSNASLDIFGVGVTDTVYVTSPASASYTLVRVSGVAGAFDLDASAKLGMCPPEFWEATICATWDWSFCETPLAACLSLSGETGSPSLTITARDIPLFTNLFGVTAALDVRLDYSIAEKSLTPMIRFSPDWTICPEIVFLGEAVLASPGPGIEAIRVYGATVVVPMGNVVFRAADSFYDETNARVTGKAAYFEVFRIETSMQSCCASPGRIEGAVYFERSPAPSGGLFGIGLLEGKAEFGVTQHLLVAFTAAVAPTIPHWTLTARVRVLW